MPLPFQSWGRSCRHKKQPLQSTHPSDQLGPWKPVEAHRTLDLETMTSCSCLENDPINGGVLSVTWKERLPYSNELFLETWKIWRTWCRSSRFGDPAKGSPRSVLIFLASSESLQHVVHALRRAWLFQVTLVYVQRILSIANMRAQET